MPQPSITCPQCGATSQDPDDIAEGYCGRCHDFTIIIIATCPICGAEPQVPCTWAGREPINDPDISHHAREHAAHPE